ncbi:hypothetical protein OpiT1DRAFT_05697 [Opitutaceae bacterium TAV1]|nr:hypothetical protein OpiT1DRAFT_05697 [Opitutaceae bacterium TAV1]
MSFFTLPNLSSHSVQPVDAPWSIESVRPAFATKDEFRLWCNAPTTSHAFLSAVEGVQPGLRVSELNPPARIHGLILDYDAVPGGPPEQLLLNNAPDGLRPAWVSRTFSGHCRVLYVFETAIPLFNSFDLTREFLKRAARELKLRKLLPGFEHETLLDPAKHYELGDNWTPVGDGSAIIPANELMSWVTEASRKHKWEKEGTAIPLDLVREEAAKRFPGKWPGGWELFDVGARGPRFWDDSASDPTATIVRETGVQFFSDGGGWMSWEAIFGTEFVRRWSADRKGNAIKDLWFDGKYYWRKDAYGLWHPATKEDIRLELFVDYRLSNKSSRAGVPTEIDEALRDLQRTKMVRKAMPFLYRPDGLHPYNGQRYLNTSTVRPIPPVDAAIDWGEGFPWLGQFLYTLFEPDDQLDYFMAWVKHFYMGAYMQDPRRGLALFIAGPPGAGKTVLNKAILGQLFGGRQDAGKYLIGKDQFNDALFGAAVWNVDDEIDTGNPHQRSVFTQMVKRIVANDSFVYRAMYTGGEDMEWLGRPIITMNDDPESLQILPEVERNILDKIMLLRTKQPDVEFWPSDAEIAAELPYFAAFLRDWTPPAHTLPPLNRRRFGVIPYHHADLLQSAVSTNATSSFEELVSLWREEWFGPGGPGESAQQWDGTPTALHQAINRNDSLRAILDTNFRSTTAIGIHLNKLLSRGTPYLQRLGHRRYAILRPGATVVAA